MGLVSKDVKEEIQKSHLSENVVLPGYVLHQEAISFQNSAQVLLLIEMNKEETSAIIPGKLFEYLRSKRPVVAIGPEKSDIEGILKETKAGEYFTYTNEVALKKSIAEKYNRYKSGKLAATTSNIDGYSRKSLTKKIAELIKGL